MSLPISLLLIPYALFLIFYFIMSLVYFFHLVRYNFWSFYSWLFIIIYLGFSALLLFISFAILITVDWSEKIDFFSSL